MTRDLFACLKVLPTDYDAYGGRLAIEATMEPSSTKGGRSGAENAGERGGTPPLNQRLKKSQKPHPRP